MASSPLVTELKMTPTRDIRLSPMNSPKINRSRFATPSDSPKTSRSVTPMGSPALHVRGGTPIYDSEAEFGFEKNRLIGELTSRMKKHAKGSYKNRRDDGSSDEEDDESWRKSTSPRPPVAITTSTALRVKPGGGGAAPSRARSKSPIVLHRPNTQRSRFLTPGHTPRASPRASPMRNAAPSRQVTMSKLATSGKDLKASLDPEIQAKIGNRAVKTVQKSIGTCGICNKVVTLEGCTAFGKVFHKDCFKCCVCKKKIDGKFFERDGKPYCSKDFQKITETCCVCNQPIKGDSVASNKKVYHPGCMTCFMCGEVLRGSYLFYEEKPICERDYKKMAETCCECGETITGKCYSLEGKFYCEKDYKGGCESCPRCEKDVIGNLVRIKGGVFHPKCFTCVVCGKNMEHDPFSKDDKLNIYCPEDYTKKFANKCSFCKNPIVPEKGQKSAPRIRALNRDFHPKCFQCEDCGLVLDSKIKGKECYPFKGHILCIKCNRKKLSSEEEDSSSDEEEEKEDKTTNA
ncbi:uncharacterized protein [Lepeophtheirus salmonis]|uniref:uncharacterized protein n=1 Tax=Lepeophtheirus salmonis TaxID=72036 RepID=UPI001AE4A5D6|nr:lipoma-preferred partner-like [Lepeophtheirus salmonis]